MALIHKNSGDMRREFRGCNQGLKMRVCKDHLWRGEHNLISTFLDILSFTAVRCNRRVCLVRVGAYLKDLWAAGRIYCNCLDPELAERDCLTRVSNFQQPGRAYSLPEAPEARSMVKDRVPNPRPSSLLREVVG